MNVTAEESLNVYAESKPLARPQWKQKLQQQWDKISVAPRYLWMMASLGVALFLLAFLVIVEHQSHQVKTLRLQETQHAAVLINSLQDIHQQLQQLNTASPHSLAFQTALSQISSDLQQLQQGLSTVAQASAVTHVSQQIHTLQNDMDNQLLNLKRTLATGSNSKQYLEASILPFQVISIDVIAGQPFVSVNDAHHQAPLAVGDALAGWTLVKADYASNTAEFENAQQQYVKVMGQG